MTNVINFTGKLCCNFAKKFHSLKYLAWSKTGIVKHIYNNTILCLQVGITERLRNQRPTLVVPPDVFTSVKQIWMGNVLHLETLLVNFLPAPKPFWQRYDFTINKFKHLRPCLCSLSCIETWQGDGHTLKNYRQYSFLSWSCPGYSLF